MSAGIEVINRMFEDDRYMSREQVYEAYLQSDGTRCGLARERLFKLDEHDIIAKLRPSSSMILDQIRQVYDSEHLLGIGRDIHSSPHGQLQNCGVAVFTTEAGLKQYLVDAGDHHERDYMGERDIVRDHKLLGGFVVTIFGHNRQLGIAALNKQQHGHPDRGLTFRTKVIYDPNYADGLAMQAVENGGKAPEIWERAMSMDSYRQVRWRDGDSVSNSDIAKIYATTEDQVWRAQQFMELPDTIKQVVIQGDIPYSGAIEFERLLGVYDESKVQTLVQKCIDQKLSAAAMRDMVSTHLLVLDFTPEIYELSMQGSLKLDELREIQVLKNNGLVDDELNRIASWIVADNPRISTVRKRVDDEVKLRRAGIRSLFQQDKDSRVFDSDPSSNRKNTIQLVAKALSDIGGRLSAVHALRTSGLVDSDAVADSAQTYVVEHMQELSAKPELLRLALDMLQTEDPAEREARLEQLQSNFGQLQASAQPYAQGALL